MERIAVFIDGHNLYHGLAKCGDRSKWCNLFKLVRQYLTPQQKLVKIFYFSAYCVWDKEKKDRHETYVRILRDMDIEVILGEYNHVTKTFSSQMPVKEIAPPKAPIPQKLSYLTYEEKKTDVHLALKMLEMAFLDQYDHAFCYLRG